MINIAWQDFPRFPVALYIEVGVFRKKKRGGGGGGGGGGVGWKCRKFQEQTTACLCRDTGILVATEGYCMFRSR